MRSRLQALSVALMLLGSALALVLASRVWLRIVVLRPRPLADQVVEVTGRSVDAAGFALALVALAGGVALVATRGWARRLVGAVLLIDGALLAWRATRALTVPSAARARSLAASTQAGVSPDSTSVIRPSVHLVWPSLAVLAGVLVAVGGALALARGHTWSAMASKYDAPNPVPSDASIWNSIDAGEDPTARTES